MMTIARLSSLTRSSTLTSLTQKHRNPHSPRAHYKRGVTHPCVIGNCEKRVELHPLSLMKEGTPGPQRTPLCLHNLQKLVTALPHGKRSEIRIGQLPGHNNVVNLASLLLSPSATPIAKHGHRLSTNAANEINKRMSDNNVNKMTHNHKPARTRIERTNIRNSSPQLTRALNGPPNCMHLKEICETTSQTAATRVTYATG